MTVCTEVAVEGVGCTGSSAFDEIAFGVKAVMEEFCSTSGPSECGETTVCVDSAVEGIGCASASFALGERAFCTEAAVGKTSYSSTSFGSNERSSE